MAKQSRRQRAAERKRQENAALDAQRKAESTTQAADGSIPIKTVESIWNPTTKRETLIGVNGDLTRDNVVANYRTMLMSLMAMPHAFDDLTRTFGIEVYERMMNDAEVFASVGVLILAATANEPNVVVSVRPDHPQYELASEIARFCALAALEASDTPFMQAIEQSLDCLWQGSSVSTVLYRDDYAAPLDDFEMLREIMRKSGRRYVRMVADIRKKPLCSVSLVIDVHLRIVGVLPVLRDGGMHPYNQIIPINSGIVPGNAAAPVHDVNGVLPRDQFLIMTWDAPDHDPRGRSILRSAYTAWWSKTQAWSDWMAYVSQFAKPSIWATPPEDAADVCIDGVTISPTELLANELSKFQGASYGAFPHGTELNKIEMNTAGNVFSEIISYANREIIRAILNQNLATSEGAHMSRAAAETHQDVLSLRIMQIKNLVTERVRRDIFRRIVSDNYGPEYVHLTPRLDLGLGDGFPISIEGVATLVKAGWKPDETQWAVLERQFGLPVRQYKEVADRLDERVDEANGKTAPPEGVAPVPAPAQKAPETDNAEDSSNTNNKVEGDDETDSE